MLELSLDCIASNHYLWICCVDEGVILYIRIRAWKWNLGSSSIAVYIQLFWYHHDVIFLCVLVAFNVLKHEYYWLQLENLLLDVSIYQVVISYGVSRVQCGAMVVDLLDYALVITVYVYFPSCG